MNERIRELAEQSTQQLHGYSYSRGNYKETYFDEEKFAELIVRECALALDKTIAPTSHPFNSIGWRLKEHFGVEE